MLDDIPTKQTAANRVENLAQDWMHPVTADTNLRPRIELVAKVYQFSFALEPEQVYIAGKSSSSPVPAACS